MLLALWVVARCLCYLMVIIAQTWSVFSNRSLSAVCLPSVSISASIQSSFFPRLLVSEAHSYINSCEDLSSNKYSVACLDFRAPWLICLRNRFAFYLHNGWLLTMFASQFLIFAEGVDRTAWWQKCFPLLFFLFFQSFQSLGTVRLQNRWYCSQKQTPYVS